MLEFVLQPENIPFSIALAIMLGIAALEGVLTVLGAGLSHLVDQLIPDGFGDIDADIDTEIDVDAGSLQANGVHVDAGHTELGATSAFSKLLGWLCVGKVPVLILLVLFLTFFGLTGLILQGVLQAVIGVFAPALLASVGALVVGAQLTRWSGLGLSRLIPKDETDAVSRDSFIGRVAKITLGEARQGTPAQAKLRDRFGLVHYVMVEPDNDTDRFARGDEVLIIDRVGAHFVAVHNTNAALSD